MEYMTLTGLPVSNFSPTIATAYTQVVPESERTLTINEYFKNQLQFIHIMVVFIVEKQFTRNLVSKDLCI